MRSEQGDLQPSPGRLQEGVDWHGRGRSLADRGRGRAEPVAEWAGGGGGHPRPQGWHRQWQAASRILWSGQWQATVRGPRLVYFAVCSCREGDGTATVSPGGRHAGVTAVPTHGRGPISGSH